MKTTSFKVQPASPRPSESKVPPSDVDPLQSRPSESLSIRNSAQSISSRSSEIKTEYGPSESDPPESPFRSAANRQALGTDLDDWLAGAAPMDKVDSDYVADRIREAIENGKSRITLPPEYSALPMPNLLQYGFTIFVTKATAQNSGRPQFPQPVVKIPQLAAPSASARIHETIAGLARFDKGPSWPDLDCIRILDDICENVPAAGARLLLLQALAARVSWLVWERDANKVPGNAQLLAGMFFHQHLAPQAESVAEELRMSATPREIHALKVLNVSMEYFRGEYMKTLPSDLD